MTHNKLFISWLADAHGMEVELVKVLEAHLEQASDYPDVSAKIAEHLEQTKNHAEIVKGILNDLGEDTSAIKSTMGHLSGMLAGASTTMAGDRLVKNAISDFASEHMEIATYNALLEACKKFGHPEIAEKLEGILADEQEMAKWLEDNLPVAVGEVLTQAEAEQVE
jgi:ferritin-like metal-binding protein YciE